MNAPRRRRCRGLGALALFVTLVPSAGAARAAGDPDADSESLIRRGVGLRRQGANREALDAFEQANAIKPSPRAEAQIALAEQALGLWVKAENGLASARESDDPWVVQYRQALDVALATVRSHLGWIDVDTPVANAEHLIDGVSVGASAQPARVVAGTHDVELRAPGFIGEHRSVEVTAGSWVRVAIDLRPIVAPAPVAPATIPVMTEEPKVAPRGGGPSRMIAYVALPAAALLTGVGIVAWRIREDNVAIYNDDQRCLVGAATRGTQCASNVHAASVALGFEIGALALAGASAVVGAGYLWAASNGTRVAIVGPCAPWAGLGVTCGGRF